MQQYLGALEAGGTKIICAIGTKNGEILHRVRIPTEDPETSMNAVIDFFKTMQQQYTLSALGCASFGPIDPNQHSTNYGCILHTPKLKWQNYNIVSTLKKALNIPIGFDTDVNAATLGEYHFGASQNLSDSIYLTIGTGIGGGIIANHQLIHGANHPEMGHIYVPLHPHDKNFSGICPYHENCLEGLASGSALKARWGVRSATELDESHQAWPIQTHYLACAIINYTLCLMPKKIILGGGVMKQSHLFKTIRTLVLKRLNDYLLPTITQENIDSLIVPPTLQDNAGICGALVLAHFALQAHHNQ